MKQSLLILLASLSIGNAFAQTNLYHEFPDSNATWNIVSQGCCWYDCPGPPMPNPIMLDYTFSYYIGGDSVIFSTNFHKIYKSGSMHEYCNSGNYVNTWHYFNDYVGAIREDTALKQVFFEGPSIVSECLLYDFNAGIGDTIDFCEYAVVSSIDSILIGSTYRKRFNLVGSPYSIIEGIGSTSGILEPLYPFEYSGTLVCFTQDSQTLYPDTTTSCNLITGVPSVPALSQQLTIVPNPFSVNTTLYAQVQMQGATLTVMNCVGETVLVMNNLSGFSVTVDRGNLPGGIYIYQLIENGAVLATARAVITD